MVNKISAQVEIKFKEGDKTIEMLLKNRQDIEECEEDKVVVINLLNGETYTGYFIGMDGDDIMLQSLSDNRTLGLSVDWVKDYFEEV